MVLTSCRVCLLTICIGYVAVWQHTYHGMQGTGFWEAAFHTKSSLSLFQAEPTIDNANGPYYFFKLLVGTIGTFHIFKGVWNSMLIS